MTRINFYQPFFLSNCFKESWLLGGNGGSVPPNSGWFPGKKKSCCDPLTKTWWQHVFLEKKSSSMQDVLLINIISIANLNWYLRNHLRCLRSSHRAARSHPLMVSRMYISTSGAWWVEGQKTQYVWRIYIHLLPILTRNLVVCKQPFTDSVFIFRGVGQSPQVVSLITEGHQTL